MSYRNSITDKDNVSLSLDNLFHPSANKIRENNNFTNSSNVNNSDDHDPSINITKYVIPSMYERFEQTVNAIKLSFVIDKHNKISLFEYVDFALHKNLTPQMRLKIFCTLLRNCTCELINQGITHIYHVINHQEYEEIKNKTSWTITEHKDFLTVYSTFNDLNPNTDDEKNVILVCDIKEFVDNIANGLGINLS